jgi:diacylglycerol kinase family enzyme
MRALLVVNPSATTTTSRARDVLVAALGDAVKLDVAETTGRHHASDLAAGARASGFDVVVALGGDGTINEVVNGVVGDGRTPASELPAVGFVPGGSSNVLARTLGFPNDPIEATAVLLEALRAGRTRTIGLGRAGERWFTFTAGLGIDAGAVARVEAARAKGRRATDGLYVRSTVREFFFATSRRKPALVAELPGEEPVGLAAAVVTNTTPWTYLGSRPVVLTPEASFDTGLDLFGMTSLPTLRTLRTVRQLLNGGPHGKRVVVRHDLAELTLSSSEEQPFQVDGDLVGRRTEVRLRSVPEALRVVA